MRFFYDFFCRILHEIVSVKLSQELQQNLNIAFFQTLNANHLRHRRGSHCVFLSQVVYFLLTTPKGENLGVWGEDAFARTH